MSDTTPSPYGGLPPTEDAASALDVKDHEHHWFAEPTEPVGNKYVGVLLLAQLIFFIALLGPAIIGMAIKVQTIVPLELRTSATGLCSAAGRCSPSSATSSSVGCPTAPRPVGDAGGPGSSAGPWR